MSLQGECALAEAFAAAFKRDGGFVVFEDGFAVDFDGDLAPANDDVLSPPLVVFAGSEADVAEAVKAAGFDPVCVTDVDLAFDAGARETFFLVGRVKIDAAIGIGLGHDLDFKVEIFERLFVTDIIQVTSIAMGHESAIFELPGVLMFFGCLPAIETFAVTKLHKACVIIRCGERSCGGKRKSGQKAVGVEFHVGRLKD